MFNVGDRVMIVDIDWTPDSLIKPGDVGRIKSTNKISILTHKSYSIIRMDKNNTHRSLYDEKLIKI